MRDVNLELGGLLLDMAHLAGDSQRAWGYKRAAKAVLRLDQFVTPLIEANTFRTVPGIGPTTDRIARELILEGRSDFVDRTAAEAGEQEALEKLRLQLMQKLRQHEQGRTVDVAPLAEGEKSAVGSGQSAVK